MVKSKSPTTGDIFSVKVGKNEYIFGRILFDVARQYIKTPFNDNTVKNYFSFFDTCFLIETFYGVYENIDEVDINKKAVESTFVFHKFYKKDFFTSRDFKIVGFKEIDYKKVSFPETLSAYHPDYYFSCGGTIFENRY